MNFLFGPPNKGLDIRDAAAKGDAIRITELLKKAKRSVVNEGDVNWGQTALMLASENGHVEVVKLLMAAGANVRARSNLGYTALMMATLGRHANVVKLLLAAGADKQPKDKFGKSALDMAKTQEIRDLLNGEYGVTLPAYGAENSSASSAPPAPAPVRVVSSSASIGVSTVIMEQDGGEFFRVKCPSWLEINGDYIREGEGGRYIQRGGSHVLVKHVTGQWGIGNGSVFIALAKYKSNHPDENVTWLLLLGDQYRESSITVERRAFESPKGAVVAPAAAEKQPAATALSADAKVSSWTEVDSVSAPVAASDSDCGTSTVTTSFLLRKEWARLLPQVPVTLRRRDHMLRMEDVSARLASAKAARSGAAVASITREKAALTEAMRGIALSEEECHALPERMRKLDDRLFQFLVELSDAADSDLATIDEMSVMQDAVTAALSAISLGEKSSAQEPSLHSALSLLPTPAPAEVGGQVYFTGDIRIVDVKAAFAREHLGDARAPSARLMKRGHFVTRDALNDAHAHYCVIKCATHAEHAPPHPNNVNAMRREHEMYLELKRLSGDNPTGCVRLYSAHPQHHYLILEDYGTDLREILNSSLRSPQLVMEAIVSAVHALHSLGIMHGDIKPQNLLYKLHSSGNYVVKLCDLDASYKVGEICSAASLGTAHYHAPELRAAALRGDTVRAALQLDMFALGLVLWQVLARAPQAALDCAEEDALYGNQEMMDAHLNYPTFYKEDLQIVTRINPAMRMNIADLNRAVQNLSASSTRLGLLHEKAEHHHTKHVVSAQLSAINEGLSELKSHQVALGRQMTELLATHVELSAMVRALTVNTHGLPTLAIVLPVVSTSWTSRFSPMRLARDQYRLYFLCSHTHQIAPCGPKGKGYKITMTKQWVLDAAPVLRVGLVLLKVALMASGLPLPVPDLCNALVDKVLHTKYLDAALQLVSCPLEDAAGTHELVLDKLLDKVDAHDYSDYSTPGAEMRLQEGSRKAYETIKEILGRDGVNIPLTCGLRQVTHRGKTAWVLDNDATERDWKSAVDRAP